jgi:uncharacterized protein
MALGDGLLLAVSGLLAGAVNAIAGGGTFFTFSALLAVGIPAVAANATSAVAVLPGSLASLAAYRAELMRDWRKRIPLCLVSMAGGGIGAMILLTLDTMTFRALIPWLLLAATGLFAATPLVATAARRSAHETGKRRMARTVALVVQLPTAIYGGFFGAGMGIVMLATLGLTEGEDFHANNAAKNLLSVLIQSIAVMLFVAAGAVHWRAAAVITVAAVVGGYAGIFVARRVPPSIVRAFVILTGLGLGLRFLLS